VEKELLKPFVMILKEGEHFELDSIQVGMWPMPKDVTSLSVFMIR